MVGMRARAAVLTLVLGGLAAAYPFLDPTQTWRNFYLVALLLLSAAAIVSSEKEARGREVRELQSSAWHTATDLREFLKDRPQYMTMSRKPFETAERHDEETARQYEARFGVRVRQISETLRRHRAIPTDVFFRHVEEGPKSDHDVFQIAAGLERLAKQVQPR